MNISKVICLGLLVIITAACGGGGGGVDAPFKCGSTGSAACSAGGTPPTPPAGATTLATSVSTLALSVFDPALSPNLNGTARTITVTNVGTETALGVSHNIVGTSGGFGVSPPSCGDIAPAATCILTVSPGLIATAAPGDTAPVAIGLSIAGTNTNAVGVSVQVLTYGSVYQSGYVFSVDDSTPTTGSIGGKVVQLLDQTATVWSATPDPVPGIDETSATNCDGKSDGVCNTGKITTFYSATSPTTYAAGLCTQAIDGYADWYLPAICELGYDNTTAGTGCGTSGTPTIQNMQTSLSDNGSLGNFTGATPYWSSTLVQANVLNAWAQLITPSVSQIGLDRGTTALFRCVRAMN